jgi:hypothetical protein
MISSTSFLKLIVSGIVTSVVGLALIATGGPILSPTQPFPRLGGGREGWRLQELDLQPE